MLPSDVPGLSRVELEPVMARAAVLGDVELVAAIVTELGARVWLAHNPYAPPDAQKQGQERRTPPGWARVPPALDEAVRAA